MRKFLAATTLTILSASAHAKVIGKVSNQDMSTDDGAWVFIMHDTEVTVGDCNGQKLVKAYYLSGDKRDLLGEGCWVPEKDKVLMKLVASGRVEVTYPIARKRIKFSEGDPS
ncbi:hypothetical protein [Serratia nematodiphila]|uniref:hypothetical protein n=1 Tax=Serratia nematodiphila TaxID=458197 RepID=UPI0010831427|nr:hypothetical protein [Serratia nematodiphila]UTO00478.1 hypothetical protein NLX84_19095 [Serratia nematodiphila]